MADAAVTITGIDLTAYLVKDIDRAKAFYRDKLGLTVTLEYEGDAEFTFGDSTFGIYQMPDGTWYAGNGVIFHVPDIAKAVSYYEGLGVQFEDDGRIDENPGCLMAFAQDTEGNHFILHQLKPGREG